MKILVAADSHLYKCEGGKYWCKTIYDYGFWQRYLSVFETVKIVSRVGKISSSETRNMLRVDGPGIEIFELPLLRGGKQYLMHFLKFSRMTKESIRDCDCALFRLPSVSAFMVLKYYKSLKRPYAVEVVFDPLSTEKNILNRVFANKLKLAVKNANGASYVTQYHLQNRYPSHVKIYGETKDYFETYFSTIDLDASFFGVEKNYQQNKKAFTIVHTANSIHTDGKGHSVVIKIVRALRDAGYDVNVRFIGDGEKRQYFENLSREMGIEDFVSFTGLLKSKQEVRRVLLEGDIFVFPTKAEGLPRAVIEAMAVGLPVLSTPVSGIPELIEDENLFEPLDCKGFTKRLKYLFDNTEKMEEMSKRNIEIAKLYLKDVLEVRRVQFYSQLKELAKQ